MPYRHAILLDDGQWHDMKGQEDDFGVMQYMAIRSGGLGYRIFLNGEMVEEVVYAKHPEWVMGMDENGNWIVKCCVCGDIGSALGKPYLAGRWYCAGACYDTLFGTCENCGQSNMSVLTNDEPLCNKCYMEKHKLGIRVISMKFR